MSYSLGNETVSTQEEFLRLACRLMAGRCDGARTHDGQGFSRFDQAFGHKMAGTPWREWSARQKWAVYSLLSKYKNTQLEPIWSLILAPPKPGDLQRLDQQREAARRGGRHSGLIRHMKVGEKSYFAIDVPWSSTVNDLIAKIPERQWRKDLKVTLIPYRFDLIDAVFNFSAETGIPIDKPVLDKLLPQMDRVEQTLTLSHASEAVDYVIPDLPEHYKPYPFQLAGVQYIAELAGGRGLVADEMGLGKTIQGLLAARMLKARRTIVISPNSAKLNWKIETERWWAGMPITVLTGGPHKDVRDVVKRLLGYDKHLQYFPDIIAASTGTQAEFMEVLNRYHTVGRRASMQSTLFEEDPKVDGWTSDHTQLALERFEIAKSLGKYKIGPLFQRDWICVLNWDILHAWEPVLRLIGYDCVIGDEFHMAKNPGARRSKACEYLMADAKYRIGLTGTPVMNDPAEFGQLIKLLGYIDVFGGWDAYWKRYVLRLEEVVEKAKLLHEVNQRARARFMVRRTKKEVLPDMPPLQHATVPVVLDPVAQARYEEVEGDIAAYFAQRSAEKAAAVALDHAMGLQAGYTEADGGLQGFMAARAKERYDAAYERAEAAKALLWWEGLKQICVEGKMKQMLEWVDDFLENSDQKLVIFASHTWVVEKIAERYGAPLIYGGTTVEQRQEYVEQFQEEHRYAGIPGPRVIAGNLQAMGTALTLTKASNVAFFEFGWNPAAHDQAAGRCHRIGQKDSVTAWYLTGVRQDGSNTVDGDIVELIAKKREIVDAITDGRGTEEDISILRELAAKVAARAKPGVGNPEGPAGKIIEADFEIAQPALDAIGA